MRHNCKHSGLRRCLGEALSKMVAMLGFSDKIQILLKQKNVT